jgi:hypothetical protein
MKKLMMMVLMGLSLCSVGFARDRDDFNRGDRDRNVREYREHKREERRERRRERERRRRHFRHNHWR